MKSHETIRIHFSLWALAVMSFACMPRANAQPRAIDTAKSSMTVHVYKAGVFSAFGHDHEISAPIASGSVDVEKRKVELHATAGALRVQDPKVSDKDRGEIQANMLGADVLDAANHPEISFQSTGAEAAGAGAWKVTGNLKLHGATQPVSMDVRESDGHYSGSCRFKIMKKLRDQTSESRRRGGSRERRSTDSVRYSLGTLKNPAPPTETPNVSTRREKTILFTIGLVGIFAAKGNRAGIRVWARARIFPQQLSHQLRSARSAWGLKYFASVSLLSGLPAPASPEGEHAGTITVGLEMDWLPTLDAGQQRIGFDGTSPENLNNAPIFARPVIRIGLPHKFSLIAAAPPPLELFGVRSHLLAFGVERPLLERGNWTLGWRGYGQVGSVRGAFTCPNSVLGFAPGSAGNPTACLRSIGG